MTPPAACLKGHSGEKCLSKYVLDLDLKMQKHFLKHLELFSHCYSIKEDWVLLLLLSVFLFVLEKTGSSM